MKQVLIGLGIMGVILGALWAFISIDRCGTWPLRAPTLTHLSRSHGPLQVGAARVEMHPHFPITVGGYGPLARHTVTRSLAPLFARAVVLEVGGEKLGLVLLDAMLIPPQLRDAIGQGQAFPTWVIATHTHSGPSGFDPRLAAELAALGPFRPDNFQTLVSAGREALKNAVDALTPARMEVGETRLQDVGIPRSGNEIDRRITAIRFDGANGPLAQLLIASAHPTLVPQNTEGLHPDWPGLLAQRFEDNNGPVSLVMQGAAGNASVERNNFPTPEAAAAHFEAAVRGLPTARQDNLLDAAWTEVHVSLPRPEAIRLVPQPFAAAVENALCDDAEDFVVLHALKLGDIRLLFVPVEPSFAAGQVLEERAHANRIISLADGYSGYVETPEAARAGDGEARRQYFPPDLLTRLVEGASLAGQSVK